MKAWVFDTDAVIEVREVPDPQPAPDEVLLEVEAAGICHTDHDILHGRYPARLPVVPGHEFAGTVREVGAQVDTVAVGDRVAVDPLRMCGTCRSCRAGRRNLCRNGAAYGAEIPGGLAEYAAVRAGNVHPIGDLPADVAALAEPLSCACHGVARIGPPPSDRVLLFGAGPIGLLLAAALHGRGIRDLTVVDRFEQRLDTAQRFGATAVETAGADLPQRLPAQEYDVVIDATGRLDVVQDATRYAHDGGTVLLFGVCPPGGRVEIEPNDLYARELRILGSFSLNGDLPAGIDLMRTTTFPLADLITDRHPLTDAVYAFSRVGQPDAMKVQVIPTMPAASGLPAADDHHQPASPHTN